MSEMFIEVLSSAELGHPVRMIELELRHGNERRDVVLDTERRREKVAFTAADGTPEIQYRYRVYLHPEVAGAEQRFESPVETSDARIFVLDPFRLVRFQTIMAVAVFSPDVYRKAFVDVRERTSGQSTVFTLEVDHDNPERGRTIAVPAGAQLDLQTRVRFVKQTGELVEGPWQATDAFTIVVANPVAEAVTT